jgi:hypothetical protein
LTGKLEDAQLRARRPWGKSWTFTKVAFVGTKTFTLRLVAGTYKAYWAPHESMFQHFTVK